MESILNIFSAFISGILLVLACTWPFIVIFLIYKIIDILKEYKKYKNSNYKFESNTKFFKFYLDTGFCGEGLTFMKLEELGGCSKILTNVYLPTETGMTEADLIYITTYGIFVIESKNYSNWIYGNEKYKDWRQVKYNYKVKFMNPIWQNKKHIKYLKQQIGELPIASLIVFSERCELKNVSYYSKDVKVLKRNELKDYLINLPKRDLLAQQTVDKIYNHLKQFTNVSDEVKKQHIEDINNNLG